MRLIFSLAFSLYAPFLVSQIEIGAFVSDNPGIDESHSTLAASEPS
jgi:hypothetical protein